MKPCTKMQKNSKILYRKEKIVRDGNGVSEKRTATASDRDKRGSAEAEAKAEPWTARRRERKANGGTPKS